MKIQPIQPKIITKITQYNSNKSIRTEYNLGNDKKLITIHGIVNGKKVAITKTLYKGLDIIKEKVITFVNGKRRVDRII